MATITLFDESTPAFALSSKAADLSGPYPRAVDDPTSRAAILMRITGGHFVLLRSPEREVRVNGERLLVAVRVLCDGDEIDVEGGTHALFSTASPAVIEPYASTDELVRCARCHQPVAAGAPCVRCPGCARVHHAAADLPCWAYAPTCAACPQPTALASAEDAPRARS